ncbi:MAG TPA: ArsR family transcriptional regulator [Deltaproteobacteria bacterium]|nr:ArsR family transcriptional regulator [Deltaproteobacteria bacterium]
MACKSKYCGTLTDEQKKILEALASASEPIATKDISAATGIPSKSVSCRLRGLKNKGFIESPVRCKYGITDAGKSQLSA